jgi:hypothetical protein
MRLIFFLPSGVTDRTTSILFPQLLQFCPLLFAPARAETSVFDFPFPFSAIFVSPFYSTFPVCQAHNYPIHCILPDGKSRAGTDDTTEEKLQNSIL